MTVSTEDSPDLIAADFAVAIHQGAVRDTDRHILRDGGRRPEDQPGIALYGGPMPLDEDVVLRIWPECGALRDPDGPPF
ncbi:hypothetical protein ACIQVL_51385 [Streptomyces sp. NPDC090499]|uniref:hypothetical protein n=1 Tax=unclassified Streptomyces TaxID=2593676 RepID=UPI0037FCCE3A